MHTPSDDLFPQPTPPALDCWYLTGPTASGKTQVGIELALRLNAEIVSLDSMTLYRGMDIGTAKPSAADRARVPHHLLDVVDPSQEYSLSEYIDAAHEKIVEIKSRGREVLFVGGTPLYLKSLLRGVYQGPPADWEFREQIERELESLPLEALHQRLQVIDPLLAAKLHVNDKRRIIRGLEVFKQTGQRLSHLQTQFDEGRPAGKVKVFVLTWPREQLHQRIDARVDQMFAAGLVEEVRSLLKCYGPFSKTALQAVGYREVMGMLGAEGWGLEAGNGGRGSAVGNALRGVPELPITTDPAAHPHPNPLPEGEGTDDLASGGRQPPEASESTIGDELVGRADNSLSLWERAGVRVGSVPNEVQSVATPEHPHPNPLPEGEGTVARSAALAACIERVKARTRQFARRQETWFRALTECTPVPLHEGQSPAEVANKVVATLEG